LRRPLASMLHCVGLENVLEINIHNPMLMLDKGFFTSSLMLFYLHVILILVLVVKIYSTYVNVELECMYANMYRRDSQCYNSCIKIYSMSVLMGVNP